MHWCIYQLWRDHWMDCWFMVFDKAPNNNMEVPWYVLQKLWVEVVLGLHVNYFDITEFQGAGLGSAQDRERARRNPMLGPHPPWWMPIPPIQHPPIRGNISQTQVAIATMTLHLVQHSTFIALCPLRTGTGDVGGSVGPSSTSIESLAGRPEREASEPHRC